MNKHIHIRDFDGVSHSKLVERARKQGLSLSEYLRLELAKLAERPTMEDIGVNLRKIRGSRLNILREEIVKMIHDGREERTQQVLDAAFSKKNS
jgi:hypothetical protein